MGEKKNSQNKDWVVCPYCGKKFEKEFLKDNGYITKTPVGDCCECANPKCESQFMMKE